MSVKYLLPVNQAFCRLFLSSLTLSQYFFATISIPKLSLLLFLNVYDAFYAPGVLCVHKNYCLLRVNHLKRWWMITSCTIKYASPYKAIPKPIAATQYNLFCNPSIMHSQLGIANIKKRHHSFQMCCLLVYDDLRGGTTEIHASQTGG